MQMQKIPEEVIDKPFEEEFVDEVSTNEQNRKKTSPLSREDIIAAPIFP